MDKSKRVFPIILIVVSAVCLLAGLGIVIWANPELLSIVDTTSQTSVIEEASLEENENSNNETSVKTIDISQNEEEEKPEVAENEVLASVMEFDENNVVDELKENPYKEYFQKNSDMAAWIKIPDTIVDFPVMWTPEDENYYLYRDFDKQKSRGGCPILDTDSNMYPVTTNLIIHGHNIKGIMFYDILNYKSKDYRDEHPYIYLYGKDYEHIYEVMAVFKSQVYYTTDTCFKFYKFFNAETKEEFDDFYNNVMDLALYDTGVTAEFGDHLITLSTCSSHVENGRFVVVGKEIEPGDKYKAIDIDVSENNQ